MHILLCPDKLKGSLSAPQAAAAIREGFADVLCGAEFDTAPIADGGEGTADVFLSARGGERITASASDAIGRSCEASYTWLSAERTAVIDMSAASGLWRISESERDPLRASTMGTGQLVLDALSRGARHILIGLGGSATNDAGIGLASALGWMFLDASGTEVAALPMNYEKIHIIRAPGRLFEAEVIALTDVINPLLGPAGATIVFGPQKGVTPEMARHLEAGIGHLASLCEKQLGTNFAETPGSGAAGGLGFGLMTFLNARCTEGFAVIAQLIDLEARIARADLVVTAEGRLDPQTLNGKGPSGVAALARKHGKPVIVFAGSVETDLDVFDACIPIADRPMTLDESRANAEYLLRSAAARTARLLTLPL